MSVLTAAIDWPDKYAVLHDWASGVTGWTTRWADQDAPRPDYPYVLLDIIATAKEGGLDEVTRSVDLTRVRDVKVTPTVANNTLYRVTINGTDFDYTSDADATAGEIVAGLVAAIGAGAEPVTATDQATYLDVAGDAETLNPSTPRLFTITVEGPLIWSNNDAGNEIEIRASGSTGFTLNVQAFVRNTRTDNQANDPGRNAANALSTLRASFGLPSVQAALRASDISIIEEGAIADLTEEVEDTFISRASMDIRLRTLSVLTEYGGFIQDVSGASTYSGPKDAPINDTFQVDS